MIIGGVEQLACAYRVESDITVLLPQQTQVESIVANGYMKPFTPDPWPPDSYGIAIDIGTTTVVATLYELAAAREIASLACLNSQKAFGQDVISRINHAATHAQGTAQLQALITADLARLAAGLLAEAKLSASAVQLVTVAGNTAMIHLLAGVNPSCLGTAPYRPAFRGARQLLAGELHLPLAAQCPVYCLPAISAFVGGDITAGLIACNIAQQSGNTLFIDIGTNGEMVLASGGRMYCCSCAAGPALEGMSISCGMRAASGAVEAVHIEAGAITCETIGAVAPAGICGSGLLSAITELRQAGVIDARGRLTKHPLVEVVAGKKQVPLADGVCLTQGDIRQVQLAKGAILSGALTLVEAAGLSIGQLDRVIVAGQFGLHLPATSLTGSGLLPQVWLEKISYAGNTAKSGAAVCLLSKAERQHGEQLAAEVAYIELSTLAGYEQRFIDCLGFGE